VAISRNSLSKYGDMWVFSSKYDDFFKIFKKKSLEEFSPGFFFPVATVRKFEKKKKKKKKKNTVVTRDW
jgi:hypothetical protein